MHDGAADFHIAAGCRGNIPFLLHDRRSRDVEREPFVELFCLRVED